MDDVIGSAEQALRPMRSRTGTDTVVPSGAADGVQGNRGNARGASPRERFDASGPVCRCGLQLPVILLTDLFEQIELRLDEVDVAFLVL
jgi:hypothetical protein